jgi:arginine/ornithine N-succinyltransferase beta subunit
LADIRAVKESVRATVAEITDAAPVGAQHVIATTRREMRAVKTSLERVGESGVRLGSEAALALSVKVGDPVRCVALRIPTPAAKQA